ncbi:MAG: hypothetical protein SPH83_01875 [Treponema sp.]|nr:hypothetical protein [Treponema sp.]
MSHFTLQSKIMRIENVLVPGDFENVIARNDYLERYSDYQNILIDIKNQLIDQLTDNLFNED